MHSIQGVDQRSVKREKIKKTKEKFVSKNRKKQQEKGDNIATIKNEISFNFNFFYLQDQTHNVQM